MKLSMFYTSCHWLNAESKISELVSESSVGFSESVKREETLKQVQGDNVQKSHKSLTVCHSELVSESSDY